MKIVFHVNEICCETELNINVKLGSVLVSTYVFVIVLV